jgi:hypothetical protein
MGLENYHHEELMKRLEKMTSVLEALVAVLQNFQKEEVRAVERTITYHSGVVDADEVD